MVKFKDGTSTRFSEGKAPFQTTTIHSGDNTKEEKEKFTSLMKALFDGRRTE